MVYSHLRSELVNPYFELESVHFVQLMSSVIRYGSRVTEARAPLAIVIPADGKVSNLTLRNGDLLWDDFVAQADRMSR